ncbi:MAG: aromatic ring-hydroxylating dioxygenase subunit alpha [Anaerolineaceae bacterium]|nr:aromatic ring-hydroxylating dioxygenase subunit alpha [Anaerolineaceae bacterium]
MIKNQWYVVLESKQVKNKPIGVTRLSEKLVFWRDSSQKVNCAFDRCPHRSAQLSIGDIHNDHLRCPFHGFEYDQNGACQLIPANGRIRKPPEIMHLQTYPTHEAHGFIWIWWGENPPEKLEPPIFFDNIDESFYYGSVQDPWKAHYSRVIENQLDVAHLPFVHWNTIGRGNRTLVEGPKVEWCGEQKKMLCTYVFNRVDDGTAPRKAQDLTPYDGQVHLEFIMPNLWQNFISEKVRVLAAFVPVDDEHTILYLRFYQKFLPVPILGKWIAQISMPSNTYIAHQDRVVVETQQPKASSLRDNNEQPIKADAPIIMYRRQREKLKISKQEEEIKDRL